MTIAILGANGQIGKSLFKYLPEDKKCFFITREILDCSDFRKVKSFFNKNKFSLIINAIAFTNVELAEEKKNEAMKINSKLPEILSIIAKNHNIPLIHFSTDYVFDGTKKNTYSEIDKPNPINFYGYSKLNGDKKILINKCKGLIIRVSSLYSLDGINFPNKVIKLIKKRNKIRIVNDCYLSPTSSDFIAKSLLKLINIKECNKKIKILNLSSKGKISFFELAKYLILNTNAKYLKKLLPIKYSELDTKVNRPLQSLLNTNMIEKDFNIRMFSWKKDFDKYIKKINEKN